MRIALILSCVAVAVWAPYARAQKAPSPEAVTKHLKAAVGDSFDVVGIESAVGRRDVEYWLAEIKAKKPGDYLLNYGKSGYDQGEVNCYFTVAAAGTVRTLGHLHRETTISPMACVGDALIVPIRVQSHNDLYHFVLKTKEKDKYYAPDWAKVVEDMKEKQKFEIRNGADKVIKLLKADVYRSVTRDVSNWVNRPNAVFEAIAPARCNLLFNFADKDDKLKMRGAGVELAVEILKKDEPVKVLVPSWQVERTHDHVEPASVQLRVGDRLLVNCGEHWTAYDEKNQKHPPVAVTQKEFVAQKQPFKIGAK